MDARRLALAGQVFEHTSAYEQGLLHHLASVGLRHLDDLCGLRLGCGPDAVDFEAGIGCRSLPLGPDAVDLEAGVGRGDLAGRT